MSITRNRSFIGKGSIYVREKGAGDAGLLPLGNCSELSLAINEEKQEQQDYENAGGGVLQTVSRINSVSASVSALSLSPNNVALALRGLVNVHTGAAQTDEAHTGYKGAFINLNHLPDWSKAFTVTGTAGTPTFVEGTDYQKKNAGIVILADGAITDGLALEIDYHSLNGYDIEGLASAGKEYEVVFDGLNEADSGKPVKVEMHLVKFNPTQALALISDDFANLPMSFDVIKDATKTGTGESQFLKIQYTD